MRYFQKLKWYLRNSIVSRRVLLQAPQRARFAMFLIATGCKGRVLSFLSLTFLELLPWYGPKSLL
jgi:hypothetical protein